MGLQRTPPQRAQASASSQQPDNGTTSTSAGPSGVGETSLPSPSRAFQPRNPRVMRSPQTGGGSSSRPAPPMYPAIDSLPAVEVGDVSTTPKTAPPAPAPAPAPTPTPATVTESAPAPARSAEAGVDHTVSAIHETRPAEEAYTTPQPASKRRKSRHDFPLDDANMPAPPALASTGEEAAGEPIMDGAALTQFEKNALYGKRYQVMMDTLGMAIKQSSEKWTYKQFEECFPKYAAANPDDMSRKYEEHRKDLKESLWEKSTALIEQHKFGPALRKIEDAVQEAKQNASTEGRPNAWRADMNAKTLSAAANLPIYDSTYARLRAEYLQLHQDCAYRYATIAEKQALLRDLESTVSDGVVDLEKTITLLDGFPNDEMVKWMESVVPTLPPSST